MGHVFNKISIDQLVVSAEAISNVAAQLTSVIQQMQAAGMDEAFFRWAQRQWDSQDVMETLARSCVEDLPAQITAFKQGRPSMIAETKLKSARTVSQRLQRKKATGSESASKRGRGRPRKGSGA